MRPNLWDDAFFCDVVADEMDMLMIRETVPKRGEMRLVERPQCFIRAGCFVRGYVKDCVTYAEAAGPMNPTAIGYVRWDILPRKDRNDNLRYEFKTYS